MSEIFEHGGESEREFAATDESKTFSESEMEEAICDCAYVVKDCIDDEDDNGASIYAVAAYQLARELERRRLNG